MLLRSLAVGRWVVLLLSAWMLGCGGVGTNPAAAAEPKVELLWPQGAPGAKGDREADKPTLTIYLPEAAKANGTAVVICPGGGYGFVAMDHEGHQIARWLNGLGVAGFIVDYRHRTKGYGHPAPLEDAQRAIRTVRAGAAEWKVDPAKIGILGFSAGGTWPRPPRPISTPAIRRRRTRSSGQAAGPTSPSCAMP
jgi:acetyl esterase/lipase